MVAAENFDSELDAKNQPSIQRVVDAVSGALGKEGVEVADALRFALKAAIELAEVAALWITDCDDLEMKLSLAEQWKKDVPGLGDVGALYLDSEGLDLAAWIAVLLGEEDQEDDGTLNSART